MKHFVNKCLAPENPVSIITINDVDIQVNKYMSIEKKREILAYCLTQSTDAETGLMSEISFKKFLTIYLVKEYTNLEFTHEDLTELSEQTYNIIISNNIFNELMMSDSNIHQDFLEMLDEFKYMRKFYLSPRQVLNDFKDAGDQIGKTLRDYLNETGTSEEVIKEMEKALKVFDNSKS